MDYLFSHDLILCILHFSIKFDEEKGSNNLEVKSYLKIKSYLDHQIVPTIRSNQRSNNT